MVPTEVATMRGKCRSRPSSSTHSSVILNAVKDLRLPLRVSKLALLPNRRPSAPNQFNMPSRHSRDRILIKQTIETKQKETSMSEEAFRQHYEQLTDDELARVLADKQDLVPEAMGVLDQEVQRRHVVLPPPPQWTRHPESAERVEALEDYGAYRYLVERNKTFRRYWYLLAMGPFVLGLALARAKIENSVLFIVVTLGWAMCVALYGLILNTRFLGFRCPQCSQSFGRGAECFNCGFPRSRK
jgi:hypothetical protein